jgi:DNA-binding transcriptional MerR regulator
MELKQINFDFEDSKVESVPLGTEEPVASKVNLGKVTLPEKKSTRGRMKLSDMKASADLVQIPSDEVLFEKSYYSIGAVADMFHVNQSLIRFWENEFDIIKPKKNAKGDRLFRPEDIKNLQLIYHLLREKKFTIDGAKEFLKKNKKADERFAATQSLKRLREFLVELKANL